MNNPCPNCGANTVAGATNCPVCGAALQRDRGPIGSSKSSNSSRTIIFIVAGVIAALALIVVVAALALLIYFRSDRADAAKGLAKFAPEKIGSFKRLRVTTHEDLPPGGTDTLDATYVSGTQQVVIRLAEFPGAEQTATYAKSRVAYFQDHATIQQRINVINKDGSSAERITLKEDAGTDIESEVIIANNKSVVLIAIGMPFGTATEVVAKIPF